MPAESRLSGFFLLGRNSRRHFALARRRTGKDEASERENIRIWMTPSIRWQPRLSRSFLEELLYGKVVFDSYLGKQQATLRPLPNEQSVNANLDFFGTDSDWRGKERNFDLQTLKFLVS